ncbi:MAG TPA: hypothetical protein VK666_15485, partial [Chryseolinea sp.]|nr:hypothetical protein [Chryseolinea sp.]
MKNFLHVVPKLLFLATILGSVSPPSAFGQQYASMQPLSSPGKTSSRAVNLESKSVKDILFSLENVYRVSFNYDDDVLQDAYLKETFEWSKSEKLEKVLSRLLTNFQMTFRRIDKSNYLILSKKSDDNTESFKGAVNPTLDGNFQQTFLTPRFTEPAMTQHPTEFTVSGVVT